MPLIALGLVALILVLLAALRIAGSIEPRSMRGGRVARGDYRQKLSLLSPAERSFYGVMRSLELPGITVLAKVRLADIVDVDWTRGRRAGGRSIRLRQNTWTSCWCGTTIAGR